MRKGKDSTGRKNLQRVHAVNCGFRFISELIKEIALDNCPCPLPTAPFSLSCEFCQKN
jgi:hypothetical protein